MNGMIIRQSREAKGWSQEDLAQQSGASQTLISFLERGVRKEATGSKLQGIAKALGITVDEILNDPQCLDEAASTGAAA